MEFDDETLSSEEIDEMIAFDELKAQIDKDLLDDKFELILEEDDDEYNTEDY